ncbi:uncharacterized protein LOC129759136 [Uranotaenia lowii]|uniref:uncharacterized protein LOC129759136 n=1 Tax=Uranotaenia lowii TaxID=190385 RepID=UPI002479DB94|nr:uncharacterized protein LOC129759136 [Uranotaenia lowii]
MNNRKCAFVKCGNSYRKGRRNRFTFFSFPKDPEMLTKWLDFYNQHSAPEEMILHPSQVDRTWMRICQQHFRRSQLSTSSNGKRFLVKDAVPCCPPGVVDASPKRKKATPQKSASKEKLVEPPKVLVTSAKEKEDQQQETLPTRKRKRARDSFEETPSLVADGNPLLHNINGYVVDLRIAAQHDTFRLPNGKLIQVRRQPKKKAPTEVLDLETPTSPPIQEQTSAANSRASPIIMRTGRNVPSKTYVNRKSCSNASSSGLSDKRQTHMAPITASALDPKPDWNPPNLIVPSLTALQELRHKKRGSNPIHNFQRVFDSRLIEAAEISLHVIPKINNLLNSTSYKQTNKFPHLKDLYHTVSYVIKYVKDRFQQLEEKCISDIRRMGYNKITDLGPILSNRISDNLTDHAEEFVVSSESLQKESNGSTPKKGSLPPDSADDEDEEDDCAIVEEKTDLIELDSEDESDQEEKEVEEESDESDDNEGKPVKKDDVSRITAETAKIPDITIQPRFPSDKGSPSSPESETESSNPQMSTNKRQNAEQRLKFIPPSISLKPVDKHQPAPVSQAKAVQPAVSLVSIATREEQPLTVVKDKTADQAPIPLFKLSMAPQNKASKLSSSNKVAKQTVNDTSLKKPLQTSDKTDVFDLKKVPSEGCKTTIPLDTTDGKRGGEVELEINRIDSDSVAQIMEVVGGYYQHHELPDPEQGDVMQAAVIDVKVDGESSDESPDEGQRKGPLTIHSVVIEDDDSLHGGENGNDNTIEDDEETEELIEIIEGDVDLDQIDDYKVVEVIDGDYYLLCTEDS